MTSLSKREASAFLKRLKNLKKDLAIVEMTAFASFVGVNRQSLTAWFSGKSVPTREMVLKLEANLQQKLEEMDIQCSMIQSYFGY